MIKLTFAIPLCLAAGLAASFTQAGDFDTEIKARQSWMEVLAYNSGILGAMTRGRMEYDADLASAAAKNMSLAAQMNNGSMWPVGSDMNSHEGTVAKAELWQNFDKVGGLLGDLKTATSQLEMDAGKGLDALKSAMGDVGKTCSGCHRDFRAKK